MVGNRKYVPDAFFGPDRVIRVSLMGLTEGSSQKAAGISSVPQGIGSFPAKMVLVLRVRTVPEGSEELR